MRSEVDRAGSIFSTYFLKDLRLPMNSSIQEKSDGVVG